MSKKFREVGGSRAYRGWKLWSEEEYIVGKFVGVSTDNYGKASWHIEVDETNIDDDSVTEGGVLALNACGSLDHKMEQIEQGETVKIIYEGQKVLEKGAFKGKEFHDISVHVAESDSTEDQEVPQESFTQL